MKRAFLFLFLVLSLSGWLGAQNPPTTPTPPAAAPVPKGVVTVHVFTASKIFPGTIRKYWVYVPAQYDASKPACVYIGQDGVSPRMTDTFDQLIAGHQMPVTVGIFIEPGNVLIPDPAKPRAQIGVRGNRSFEYNSLGDDYARFLLDELLPVITREMKLNLSTSGNDRCIGGGSSGSSIAFTTAWEHPEAFSRVFNVSGAFPFARGSCYSVVVRKTEPKPLRLYLHVGQNDMYNANGDLFMDNEKLDHALAFSGYDVQYVTSDGHHMDKYLEVFPDAMTWLWRDWPAPIVAGAGAPRIQQILVKDEPWKPVVTSDGPIGGITVNPKGEVFFSDTTANKILRIDIDGHVSPFSIHARKVGALTVDADGTIYGVSENTGDVVAFNAEGKVRDITDGLHGRGIVATRSGGLYVSVPGPAGTAESKIWYVSPKGEKKLVDTGLKGATGMAISADNWLLNVSDSRSHFVYSYQINPDGTLANREPFNWIQTPDTADESGADGIAIDETGTPFVATNMGIQTDSKQGSNECIFPVPGGPVTGVIFGGPAFDTLYAACGDKIFFRKVQVHGVNAFQPPSKLDHGKLARPVTTTSPAF